MCTALYVRETERERESGECQWVSVGVRMWSRVSLRRVEAEKTPTDQMENILWPHSAHTGRHPHTCIHPIWDFRSCLTVLRIPKLGQCDVFRALNTLTVDRLVFVQTLVI